MLHRVQECTTMMVPLIYGYSKTSPIQNTSYSKALKITHWKKSADNVFKLFKSYENYAMKKVIVKCIYFFFFFKTMKTIQWSWLAKIFWIKIGKVFNKENHCKNILILKLLKKNVEEKNLLPKMVLNCLRTDHPYHLAEPRVVYEGSFTSRFSSYMHNNYIIDCLSHRNSWIWWGTFKKHLKVCLFFKSIW